MECGGTLCRHIESYDIRLASRQIGFDFFLAKSQAMLVIDHDLRTAIFRYLAL